MEGSAKARTGATHGPEPLRLRRATRDDAELLVDLGVRTFRGAFASDNEPADIEAYVRQTFDPRRVAAELEDRANIFLLAFAGRVAAPAGYAKLRAGEPHPSVEGPAPIEIERLYVLQDSIGRGVGAALMRACLEEAARAGRETVWLGVWERNERAIAFYRRWGFELLGSHVFQLGSDPQNDLVMARPVK